MTENVTEGDAGAPADAGTPADKPVTPPAPAYAPNFKYKVDREEREIPEYLRGLVKDANSEKQVREIMEKADGLESIKPRYEQTRTRLKDVETKYAAVNEGLEELGQHIKNGDLDSVIDMLQINPKSVLQWALNAAQYEQLPDAERARIDEARNAKREARDHAKRAEQLERHLHESSSHAREVEFHTVLARPDVTQFESSLDNQLGEGFFRSKVIQTGQWVQKQYGRDLTVNEAVGLVMKEYAKIAQAQASQPAPGPTGAQGGSPTAPATPAAPAKEPPVIPAIGSGSASPTKQVPKNMDDLQKLAAAARARLAGNA